MPQQGGFAAARGAERARRNSPSMISALTPWITGRHLRCGKRDDVGEEMEAISINRGLRRWGLCRVLIKLLFFGIHQAFDEPLLHQHHHQRWRQHGEDGGGHHDVPVHSGFATGQHALDADDDRVHVFGCGHEQRPQILVPAVDELDDEERRDRGFGQGHQDVLEKAHGPGAVDARGLYQLVRHGQKELAEQKGGGADAISAKSAPAWQNAHFHRQHQGQKDGPEANHLEREAKVHDGKGRQQRDGDLADGDDHRRPKAHPHHVPHIGVGAELARRPTWRAGNGKKLIRTERLDISRCELSQERSGQGVTDSSLGPAGHPEKRARNASITASRWIVHRMPANRTWCGCFGNAKDAVPSIVEIKDYMFAEQKRSGVLLAGLEHLDDRYLKAVGYATKSKKHGMTAEGGPGSRVPKMVLFGDIVGDAPDEVARVTSEVVRIANSRSGEGFIAISPEARKKFWLAPQQHAAISRHTNAFKINEDVVIPLPRMAEYTDGIERINIELSLQNNESSCGALPRLFCGRQAAAGQAGTNATTFHRPSCWKTAWPRR
ncbi:hypothetical protein FQA39_LY19327 [Lamprigera yunnana]|nr:hypothetical protein FQA39_LY19327 [Lamprigera yunnana]